MEENKEKAILKTEKAYKRSNRLMKFLAGLFSVVVFAGVIVGFVATEKTKISYQQYRDTPEYRVIYQQDMNELNASYHNKLITREEYDKRYNYMISSKQGYVEENLNKSDSEIKGEIDDNNKLLVSGIAASVAGVVGVVGSGVVATKKREKYEEEIEKLK